MLPIIRRIRKPLLPLDPPAAAPAPPSSVAAVPASLAPEQQPTTSASPTAFSSPAQSKIQKRIDFVLVPSVSPESSLRYPTSATNQSKIKSAQPRKAKLLDCKKMQTTPPSSPSCPKPPTGSTVSASPAPNSPTPQNRYSIDFVQFCSGSPDSPSGVSQPSTLSSQLSTINSPPLWHRQPDEDPIAYQLFAAWLQLPVPRPSRKAAAAALGCSLHRLSRLFTRHRWKTRTTAFDNHRANAASRGLDELLQKEAKDWHERARQFHLQEWALHEQMMASALAAVARLKKHPSRASLANLAKLLDLASILGRRACGLPLEPGPAGPDLSAFRAEVEAAVRKAYGPDAAGAPSPTDLPGQAAAQAPRPTT